MQDILKSIQEGDHYSADREDSCGFYDHTINAVDTAKLGKTVASSISRCTDARRSRLSRSRNWDLVKQVKKWLRAPGLGSGDVTTIRGAFAKFRETGCDGVLIGRGGRPIRGSFVRSKTRCMVDQSLAELADKRAILHEYFDMLREDMPKRRPSSHETTCRTVHACLQGGALFALSIYHSHTR